MQQTKQVSREAISRGWLRCPELSAGLPHPLTQEIQNIILYFGRDFFRTHSAGDSDGFLIGIQEMNTVRADPQMLLKIVLYVGPQVVVQIVEHQVGDLLTALVRQ
jgi:hypothetical protein